MKKKLIEKTEPIRPKGRKDWQQTIQEIGEILVINIWYKKELVARHCVNVDTRDFATLKKGTWYETKIEDSIGMPLEAYSSAYYCSYGIYSKEEKDKWNLSKEDEKRILELMDAWKSSWRSETAIELISHAESDLMRERRASKETRRQDRVRAMMDRVPPLPTDWSEWIDKTLAKGRDWLLKSKETKDWHCSACGGTMAELKGEKNLKDGQEVECPLCGKKVVIRKRKRSIEIKDRAHLIQPIDDQVSVARHFTIYAEFYPVEGGKKEISWQEEVRLILNKDPKAKYACDIYWAQWSGFDNRGNPTNRRIGHCYLYDGGIEEAFKATEYEPFARLFKELAAAGAHLDYNDMMVGAQDEGYVGMMEMLWRGRFYRIMEDESSTISLYNYEYRGEMNLRGRNAEEVLQLHDKQKINRIRNKNGGKLMLIWMRYSDAYGEKISDAELLWLERNGVWPSTVAKMGEYMTITQIINYAEKQKKASYPGWKGDRIIEQWHDYMNMCERLKKHLDDEMVYKPRELKRRHDEAVKEIEARAAELQAEEYSRKYKEAEKVLKQIRKKFEFSAEDFLIVVPRKIVEIVQEGRALHHCVGATERYFDRIKQNETYICFLRKAEAPDEPFYTVEVEPGGTIRQHRGMFDEEPEIEKVKPFLQKWQKEIRKRMSKEDHELAAVSKEKREANIEELKARKNTRVLEGLMEDFMEAK